MEEHRLLPMQEGYDEELFNKLYEELTPLKRKLASQINPSGLGINKDDIMSWFDVKFIFVFNKYMGKMEPPVLKGHLISALQLYKNRILKYSISAKNTVNHNTIDITELTDLEESYVNYSKSDERIFLDLINIFMKSHLSYQAYQIYQIEYNPPLYIIDKLNGDMSKLTTRVIIDYLGLNFNKKVSLLIKNLRNEVSEAIGLARQEFSLSNI